MNICNEKNYCNLYIIKISEDMDTSTDPDVDTNTTIAIDPEDHSSPMLIDVIDLTKESPRNRPSQSRYRYPENAYTSRHTTRSSRRLLHREVLSPIAIGGRYDIEQFV